MNVTAPEPDEPVVDDVKAVMRRVNAERNAKAISQVGLILFGLNRWRNWQGTPKHVYAGTTKRPSALRKRRAKNKVAKASRKANR